MRLRKVLPVLLIATALLSPSVIVAAEKTLTPQQIEAKRKCPTGPYDRCGELVGAYPKFKNDPPASRIIGGRTYLIPADFFQSLDPTGQGNQLTAYWIPLAHKVDGSEIAGTLFARESMKYGMIWPFGVRISLKTNPKKVKNPSTYTNCAPIEIANEKIPAKMYFDMTAYRDRSKDYLMDTCYVSDDPRYEYFPGVPVTYKVSYPYSQRNGWKGTPHEERAVGGFAIHDDKVYVEYMFQSAMFPYWKEIHESVLALIKSWEK
ncbi:hypothetical protein [Herbaspirillum camelliae]|uniref:hypothetical protein n=1 Tax=Herbaspirillum camelliae TaxID=1892903 RepID=UPI000A5AC868|nr:hypothetical protein [Herbaspirillum camelliae]